MKSSKQCPKCHSLRIGYLENAYELCEALSSSGVPFAKVSIGILEAGEPGAKREIPSGRVESFVCTECGYFETYVKDPLSVPFEHLKGFHWINPEDTGSGPYR